MWRSKHAPNRHQIPNTPQPSHGNKCCVQHVYSEKNTSGIMRKWKKNKRKKNIFCSGTQEITFSYFAIKIQKSQQLLLLSPRCSHHFFGALEQRAASTPKLTSTLVSNQDFKNPGATPTPTLGKIINANSLASKYWDHCRVSVEMYHDKQNEWNTLGCTCLDNSSQHWQHWIIGTW